MSTSSLIIPSLYIGVDGGGTSTTIIILDSAAQTLSESSSGSTNFNSVGKAQAEINLVEGINLALGKIDKSKYQFDLTCVKSIICGISGCNHPNDSDMFTGFLSNMFNEYYTKNNIDNSKRNPVYLRAYNDSVAALASGTLGDLFGIVLISGTGMIGYGVNNRINNTNGAADKLVQNLNSLQDQKNPTEWITGGNGGLIDPGCGFNIGLDCIKLAFQLSDGMIENQHNSKILQQVMEHAQITAIEDLVPYIYNKLEWSRIAAFAPVALNNYHIDPFAKQIIEKNCEYLVLSVLTLQRKLNFDPNQSLPIVFCGGILQNEIIQKLVSEAIKSKLPNAVFTHTKVDPAEGAALLGRKYVQSQKQ